MAVEGVFEFKGVLKIFRPIFVPDPPDPVDPDPDPEPGDFETLDWNSMLASSGTMVLESGKNYRVENYSTHTPTAPISITTSGAGRASIYFGVDGFSPWEPGASQARYLFNSTKMEHNILIENVNIYSAESVNEVQPFFLTIFGNTPATNQTATYKIKNCNTNAEIGFLYSGQQTVQQHVIAENVNFTGIMWQELKANNGGGLKSTMLNCVLNQVDPITHFAATLTFSDNDTVVSSVSFNRINNQFNSWGNSCNILLVAGKTFYLPNTGEFGTTRTIRPIPNISQVIDLEWTGSYLRTNDYSLQVGDVLTIGGVNYTIEIKDRVTGAAFESSGYSIDFKLDVDLPVGPGTVSATVVSSSGLSLIGVPTAGYMIFKYNKHFQTNADIAYPLSYYLESNPFGVLSYNHKEITVDWENVEHNGYYRQTSSGVGSSNGYRMVNCEGFDNEFSPGIEITTT